MIHAIWRFRDGTSPTITLTLILSHRGRGNCHGDSRKGCAEGQSPPEDVPVSNSLESLFDKGGLRGLIASGQTWRLPRLLLARLGEWLAMTGRSEVGVVSAGFASPYLPYGCHSRFRGNDRTGAAGCCRGVGCPQILFLVPQEWGQGVDGGFEALLTHQHGGDP
jgi:hypothetical protein